MSRRSRGKKRAARRRAHVLATAGARPGLVAAAEQISGKPLEAYQKRILEGIEERAKSTERGRCPECGRSEKVRKDGTMTKHTALVDGSRVDCPGVGKAAV